MIKKLSVLFLALAFVFSAFAQERKVEIHEMKVPDANYAPVVSPLSNTLNKVSAIGDLFITTDYDYAANNQIGLMVSLADIDGSDNMDAIFTAMKRADAGTRKTFFGYKAFGVVDAFDGFGVASAGSYGWGTLQLCEGGALDGNALLMAHKGGVAHHSVIDLVNLAVVEPIPTVTFGSNFPSFAYQDDGTIIATVTTADVYVSTDVGATFSLFAKIGDGDPNVNMAGALDLPSEMHLNRSDDGQYVVSVAAYEGLALTGNPDVVYWYGSTDFGATWNGLVIGEGSGTNPTYGQVVNRPNYAPYFENFAQGNFAVDNNGVTHVAFNGYGEGQVTGTDTVNLFPILYWNSNNAQWMEISVPEVAQEPNSLMADQRPGNGIGQAYPNLSVSEDGMVVFAVWAAPEYTGAVGASPVNIFPGDGGTATAAMFYTDLHWALSVDGGATWTTPSVLGEPSVSETYPAPAKRLELVANTSGGFDVYVHMLFFVDAIPGTSLFATNNGGSNNSEWRYITTMVGTYTPTGVEDDVVVNNFSLEQNYPNPFNPSTKIKYSVAEVSNVSIKVYDMLGKEVANLVNSQKAAGSHEVSFDASNLASGMYVYTITAGNFVSSKKMMLLK